MERCLSITKDTLTWPSQTGNVSSLVDSWGKRHQEESETTPRLISTPTRLVPLLSVNEFTQKVQRESDFILFSGKLFRPVAHTPFLIRAVYVSQLEVLTQQPATKNTGEDCEI